MIVSSWLVGSVESWYTAQEHPPEADERKKGSPFPARLDHLAAAKRQTQYMYSYVAQIDVP